MVPPRNFTTPQFEKRWIELLRGFPEIREMDMKIKEVADSGNQSFCANEIWYGFGAWKGNGFKKRLSNTVGFLARDPELRSSEVYDVVYRKLYDQLPHCRNCGCA